MNDQDILTVIAAKIWCEENAFSSEKTDVSEDEEIAILLLKAFLSGVSYAENRS